MTDSIVIEYFPTLTRLIYIFSVDDFLEPDRPDWQRIMKLVTQIYIHFTQQENTLENIL